MSPEAPSRATNARPRAIVRAWLLACAAVLVIGPAVASAADPEPSPIVWTAPVVEPSPIVEPSPTIEPSPSVEPSPSEAPAPSEAPSPTVAPTPSVAIEALDATPPPDPTSAPAAPAPTVEPTPAPILESFLVYRRSAIVRQYTSYWCVPAAVQTMMNLLRGESNTSYLRQSVLYRQIRQHNRYSYSTLGNDVQGWAWALRQYTYKPYYARAYLSKTVALDVIVDSLKRTRHPVGVTVKAGTHAWIVLGYRASVDPVTSKRTILGFYVSGPLGYPADPYPYRYLTLAAFNKVYTRYHEWQRRVIWEGMYVVVNH